MKYYGHCSCTPCKNFKRVVGITCCLGMITILLSILFGMSLAKHNYEKDLRFQRNPVRPLIEEVSNISVKDLQGSKDKWDSEGKWIRFVDEDGYVYFHYTYDNSWFSEDGTQLTGHEPFDVKDKYDKYYKQLQTEKLKEEFKKIQAKH